MTGLSPRLMLCTLIASYCVIATVYAASDTEQRIEDSGAESINTTEISRILALSDDFAYGEYLAGECASCHSDHVATGSNVPIILGATKERLVKALLEYRAGIRTNISMQQVALGLGDEEMAAVVHYLATSTE